MTGRNSELRGPKGGIRANCRSRWAVTIAAGIVACGRVHPGDGLIAPPLRTETMVEGGFVAYTLYWEAAVPGGDPIHFRADGIVENTGAGLAGRWSVTDDSTLIIFQMDTVTGQTRSREFRLRPAKGGLVSPIPLAGQSQSPVFWIRRKGAPVPP